MSPIFLGNGESKAAVAMGIVVFASGNSPARNYLITYISDNVDSFISLNSIKDFSNVLGLLTTVELFVKPRVKLRLTILFFVYQSVEEPEKIVYILGSNDPQDNLLSIGQHE